MTRLAINQLPRRQNALEEVRKSFTGARPQSMQLGDQQALHLRTGDTIPCEVTGIDEKGITIKTPVADAKFVPREKIKAIEFHRYFGNIKVDDIKRERLLTLPRMQKNNPPTHLIRSTSGDYLRARIVEMKEETLVVEVRLDTKEISREAISQIIWLHDDETQPSEEQEVNKPQSNATRVQALRSDGTRLTFFPEELKGDNLIGTSDVIGACQVDLSKVNQLIFGAAIEKAVSALVFQQWKLHNAAEPRYVTADGAASSGTESPLVGQPAPDFELDLLDGKPFLLSEQKGRVMVLDFWASWCGPCIKAMPQVDEVVEEFAEQGVRLVAVNLEEPPDKIQSALDRFKLDVTVALDRDGVVAHKYEAVAIPQTVVIDREGKIARVFVGGSDEMIAQLREVLTELTGEGEKPKAE